MDGLTATGQSTSRVLALPVAGAAALAGLAASYGARPELSRTLLGAAAAVLVWCVVLRAAVQRRGRALELQSRIRRHHWVQACAQLAVLLYWGWHARFVYGFLPLIGAQLAFAYAVDSLLTWSRRNTYQLGFGPFPVILSINLFLWFRPEWFHLQFAMIALGYVGKEMIRWSREGSSAHIFNPSSLPLAIFSLALILTGSSDITYGNVIANSQFDPPFIYLVIFLASLPGQTLFGVARMTLPAVVSTYAISEAYFAATGTYLFYDAHIPVPVFLGMHLLFTDPSTSPRTDLGRIAFGGLYGLLVVAFNVLLTAIDAPTFYDKLLPVPFMNLCVRGIDCLVDRMPLGALAPWMRSRSAGSRRRDLAYVSVWMAVFASLSGARALGDEHPGQYLPFWVGACQAGSERACDYAAYLTLAYCNNGSGWACNEVGLQLLNAGGSGETSFRRACDLGYAPGCENATAGEGAPEQLSRTGPELADLRIVLRGTKPPLGPTSPAALYAIACEQGWPGACPGS